MARFSNTVNIRNKRAGFEFELLDKYVAGIVLKGSEIKSLREGKAALTESYCFFSPAGELFVKGLQITPYAEGSYYNHEPLRERKLLMRGSELRKLQSKVEEKGLTLVPLRLFINERGLAKLELAVARGKKLHDKRSAVREREVKRELGRILK
jgi:SsrA-binding protein